MTVAVEKNLGDEFIMPMTETLYVRAKIADAPLIVELGSRTMIEKTCEGKILSQKLVSLYF